MSTDGEILRSWRVVIVALQADRATLVAGWVVIHWRLLQSIYCLYTAVIGFLLCHP
jgi:hypothetical protein